MRILRFMLLSVAVVISILYILELDYKKKTDRPLVVTTTNLIADIARSVGGDFIEVESLMSAGIDPHMYRASEGDVIKLSSADLILHNGLHLEGKLGEVLERMQKRVQSIVVTEYIPTELIIKHTDTPDPHVWFDPRLWIYVVNRVADGLVGLDPSNALYYRKNEDILVQAFLSLYDESKIKLDKVPAEQRILVTSHDAFTYFGRAFGWEVLAIQGINTASETSVNTIQTLAKIIVDKKINCIFTETSVSPRFIEALSASVSALGRTLNHGRPLYSDSLGSEGTGAETYVDMFKENVDSIVEGILNDKAE